jgi:hypothetical protein
MQTTGVPVILPEDRLDAWLSGDAGNQMTVWPISPRVNTPKNDDPDILEPILADVQARRPDN